MEEQPQAYFYAKEAVVTGRHTVKKNDLLREEISVTIFLTGSGDTREILDVEIRNALMKIMEGKKLMNNKQKLS